MVFLFSSRLPGEAGAAFLGPNFGPLWSFVMGWWWPVHVRDCALLNGYMVVFRRRLERRAPADRSTSCKL